MLDNNKQMKEHIMRSICTIMLLILAYTSSLDCFANQTPSKSPDIPTITKTIKTPNSLLVSLNNSSVEELQSLHGVGKTKAEAIVAYRKNHGAFKKIEELAHVNGIGVKIIKQNQDRLSL